MAAAHRADQTGCPESRVRIELERIGEGGVEPTPEHAYRSQAGNGAAYLTITGGASDDALTGASVSSSVAAKVELHETVAASGDGAMGSSTLAPSMAMRPVASIQVPAGKTVSLAPGGYHLMMLQLAKPLVVGQSFELTLTFVRSDLQ